MDTGMEQKYFRVRLSILGGTFALLLAVYAALMYNAQIVHGEEYLLQSVNNITTTETVEASRGIITDRNGKVLVSNRLSYTLTFDSSAFAGDDAALNAAVLRLIQLCEEKNVPWVDTLPLSSRAPFSYAFDSSETQISRLGKFIVSQKWSDKTLSESDPYPDICAQTFFTKMRELFKIDDTYSLADARKIMGVRYELAVRTVVNTSAYVFAEDFGVDLISLVIDGDYKGVKIGSSSVRQYETKYAAHVLGRIARIFAEEYPALKEKGYAMDELVGKDGVEAAFEDYLRGTDGRRIISTNSEGKITSELYSTVPEPGGTVALTLDIDLQGAVEEALDETVTAMTNADHTPRNAAAVVVQVGTGDVLALASYPTYDLATYAADYEELSKDPLNPFYNRATMGTYAPGSTFKMVTAAAALESGIITPSTTIRTTGKYTFYPDYQPRCWIYNSTGGSHGTINVSEAIKVSCNYFFYEVGRLTGISTIAQYAAAFGLGEATGIEIPERVGVMTKPDYFKTLENEYWTDGQTLAAAIGQSKSVFTPLQLANYIATLLDNGTRHNAHLLKNVKTYNNSSLIYVYDEPPVETLSLKESTIAAIKKGMGDLVTSGSVAYYFKDCVVSAGAKTGSAQTGQTLANGVFVAFAPFDEPQIAVAVVIEKGGSGSALASTAVAILNAYFDTSEIGVSVLSENTLLQ